MAIDVAGLNKSDIEARIACVKDAWNRAQGKYTNDAILAHTSKDLVGLLAGAITMVIAGALIILIGNVAGAAFGGALGAMAGGAGAAPGAAAGRLIGNYIATAFLEILGIGLLLVYIANELGTIGAHFYAALDCAWNSQYFGGDNYEMRMEYAAKHMAEGVGKFFGAMVMALVIVLTRGKVEEKTRLANSKLMKLCDKLELYLVRNISTLQAKYRGGLAKATVTSDLPSTPEGLVAQRRAAIEAAKPFGGMPSFYRRSASELRAWLKANQFAKVAEVRKPGSYKQDGTKSTDYQSEIWMRQKSPNGDIECVRIDPNGHVPPKFRDGPIRVQQDPKTGQWKSERIAWGERPHYHLETIPASKAIEYRTQYVPDAITYEANGKSVPQMMTDHANLAKRSLEIYGPSGELTALRSKFEMIHIPLGD